MYIRTYVRTYACMYVCMYVCMYACICVCPCVCVCVCVCARTHAHAYNLTFYILFTLLAVLALNRTIHHCSFLKFTTSQAPWCPLSVYLICQIPCKLLYKHPASSPDPYQHLPRYSSVKLKMEAPYSSKTPYKVMNLHGVKPLKTII
jgi:hypothetical protein